MNKSESIRELAKALAQFQSEVVHPLKDKSNPFFKSKYVPLENVVEAITNTAPKLGLSFIQYPVASGEYTGIVTVLMHSSGEYIETEPVYAKPVKQDPQAVGSVITYLKRYSLSAVFGITSDEDDDGNKATHMTNSNNKPAATGNLLTQNQKNDISNLVRAISSKTSVPPQQVLNNTVQQVLGYQKDSQQLTYAEADKILKHLATFQ